ncbi:class I SAM-dependent methyltransferase [Sphingomonas sp. PAMC 26621]|uniref:class I SAM-dependent methyltransferase n=1 Tax=Sphingomonas sp. PAMC 26621 TaxID=1112213 RepID=UPI0002898E76|nr:class I SAM-dependent methyltransferase [Sphingomonas sp. PAMC 26621]
MERSTVIQFILDLYKDPTYLEIGVDQGVTFDALRANLKVAVDVRFAFDLAAARASADSVRCEYHETASDAFFADRALTAPKFDVVFIDGLHTFEQTLRDLLNASYVLAEGGTIVVDDVMPSGYAASIPDLDLTRQFWTATNNPDGSWMGDVYRLIFFIQDFLGSFSYATVEENHGQTVLWKKPRHVSSNPARIETISRLGYIDAVMGKAAFNFTPLAAILPHLAKQ